MVNMSLLEEGVNTVEVRRAHLVVTGLKLRSTWHITNAVMGAIWLELCNAHHLWKLHLTDLRHSARKKTSYEILEPTPFLQNDWRDLKQ